MASQAAESDLWRQSNQFKPAALQSSNMDADQNGDMLYASFNVSEISEGKLWRSERREAIIQDAADEGKLFTWGSNESCQLGHGDSLLSPVPSLVQAAAAVSVSSVAMGSTFMVFASVGGEIFTVGSGQHGELGLQSIVSVERPSMVKGLRSKVYQVVAGESHVLALAEGNHVYAWGCGAWGALGLGSDADTGVPVIISNLEGRGITKIAAGSNHSAAVTGNGELYTWGCGLHGRLGHGSQSESSFPQFVESLRGKPVNFVKCGSMHTMVALVDGSLFMCGSSARGQLGFGDRLCRETLTSQFLDGSGVMDGACGDSISVAVTYSGVVYLWGDPSSDRMDFIRPVKLSCLPTPSVIIGLHAVSNEAFAILDNGECYRFSVDDVLQAQRKGESLSYMHSIRGSAMICGRHGNFAMIGSLQRGLSQAALSRSRMLDPFRDVCQVSDPVDPVERGNLPEMPLEEILETVDNADSAKVLSPSKPGEGQLMTWGKGQGGRLGHGIIYFESEKSILRPAKVLAFSKVSIVSVSLGESASAAISDTGTCFVWGNNAFGMLGLGPQCEGQHIVVPQAVSLLQHHAVVEVSMGFTHMLCLHDTGTVWASGSNMFGQLGVKDGATKHSSPVKLNLNFKVQQVCAGGFHSMLLSDNQVFTFGKGWRGQLGLGDHLSLSATAQTQLIPRKIEGINPIIKLFAGEENSSAIDEDGNVLFWGENSKYQLGLGDNANPQEPVLNEFLVRKQIKHISLGHSHTLALTDEGGIYAFGNNSNGQCGLGLESGKKIMEPTLIMESKRQDPQEGELQRAIHIEGLTRVVSISASGNWSCAITKDNKLYTWGCGRGGKQGSPEKEDIWIPTHVDVDANRDDLPAVHKVYCGPNHAAIIAYDNPFEIGELESQTEFAVSREASREDAKEKDQASKLEKLAQLNRQYAAIKNSKANMMQDVDWRADINNYLETFLKEIDLHDIFELLVGHDLDYATLLTLNDAELKELGVSIGHRRKLLHAMKHIERQAPKMFNATQNPKYFLLNWAHSHALDEAREQQRQRMSTGESILDKFLNPMLRNATLRCIVRYSELEHLNRSIPGQGTYLTLANERFNAAPDASFQIFGMGLSRDGELGTGYPVAHPIVQEIPFKHQFKQIVCGPSHTLGLDVNGGVYGWGQGTRGQLGLSDALERISVSSLVPVAVAALQRYAPILQIATGRNHSMALSHNRQVLAWGQGMYGQLGQGSEKDYGLPQVVGPLEGRGVCQLTCGGWHSVAINESGKVFSWGKNANGQLGVGDVAPRLSPEIVQGLRQIDRARSIVAGDDFTVALLVNGDLYAFGKNDCGQLGISGRKFSDTPRKVSVIGRVEKVVQISAGSAHCLALCHNGQVFSWGNCSHGQLGHGDLAEKSSPTTVSMDFGLPPDVVHISAGGNSSAAVTLSGRLFTWGAGDDGQLGIASRVMQFAPTEVDRPSAKLKFSRVIMGVRHAFVVSISSPSAPPSMSKKPIAQFFSSHRSTVSAGADNESIRSGTSGALSAAAGESTSASTALSESRADEIVTRDILLSWGYGPQGQLGVESILKCNSPHVVAVPSSIFRISKISAGDNHSAAIIERGQLWLWGANSDSQLGLGHAQSSPLPARLQNISAQWLDVSCGRKHTVAVASGGQVYSWGSTTYGAAGDVAGSEPITKPQKVTAMSKYVVQAVSAGGKHSAAITAERRLVLWGDSRRGQCGAGFSESCIPHLLAEPRTVLAVSCGGSHTICLSEESRGNVYTFGCNSHGQLGNGTSETGDSSKPYKVESLKSLRGMSIAAGRDHCVAVVVDPSNPQEAGAVCWGDNARGQCGIPPTAIPAPPITAPARPAVPGDFTAKSVWAGSLASVAANDNGQLYWWGSTTPGPRDMGPDEPLPVQIPGMPTTSVVSIGGSHFMSIANVEASVNLSSGLAWDTKAGTAASESEYSGHA